MIIRIKQYTFKIDEPFVEGSILNAGEAQALNGLRAENIRNNVTRMVQDEVAVLEEGELLPVEVLDGLQARITEYDTKYQFMLKHTSNRTLGALDAEAQKIASEVLAERASAEGLVFKVGEYRAEVAKLAASEPIQKRARQALGAKQAIATSSIEDLL